MNGPFSVRDVTIYRCAPCRCCSRKRFPPLRATAPFQCKLPGAYGLPCSPKPARPPTCLPAAPQVCSVVTRVLGHVEKPDENPLAAVAPAPRPQSRREAPAPAAASAGAAGKGLSSTGKGDYHDPHRTVATVAMSTVSSSAPAVPPRRASLSVASAASAASAAAAAGAAATARGFASVGEPSFWAGLRPLRVAAWRGVRSCGVLLAGDGSVLLRGWHREYQRAATPMKATEIPPTPPTLPHMNATYDRHRRRTPRLPRRPAAAPAEQAALHRLRLPLSRARRRRPPGQARRPRRAPGAALPVLAAAPAGRQPFHHRRLEDSDRLGGGHDAEPLVRGVHAPRGQDQGREREGDGADAPEERTLW